MGYTWGVACRVFEPLYLLCYFLFCCEEKELSLPARNEFPVNGLNDD